MVKFCPYILKILNIEKKWQHQFFRGSRAANSVVRGWIWPNFKLIQALMYGIVTCRYEKDLMENSWGKVATPFFPLKNYGDFSDAQEQLTPQMVVGSGRISNSSELSCMSSIPASMKRIGYKTAGKKWLYRFYHYKPICCHGNHLSCLAEFRTHSSSHVKIICHRYLQVWKGSDQEQPRKSGDTFFPL